MGVLCPTGAQAWSGLGLEMRVDGLPPRSGRTSGSGIASSLPITARGRGREKKSPASRGPVPAGSTNPPRFAISQMVWKWGHHQSEKLRFRRGKRVSDVGIPLEDARQVLSLAPIRPTVGRGCSEIARRFSASFALASRRPVTIAIHRLATIPSVWIALNWVSIQEHSPAIPSFYSTTAQVCNTKSGLNNGTGSPPLLSASPAEGTLNDAFVGADLRTVAAGHPLASARISGPTAATIPVLHFENLRAVVAASHSLTKPSQEHSQPFLSRAQMMCRIQHTRLLLNPGTVKCRIRNMDPPPEHRRSCGS